MMDSLQHIFISNAFADSVGAASAAPSNGGMSFLMIFIVFFAFIYLTIWRPQSKRAQLQQQLLHSLAQNDEVITVSGTLGRIVNIKEQYVTLAIANDVEIILQKTSIASVLPKGTMQSIASSAEK